MPNHYREAEELLDGASGAQGGSDYERYALAAAQIHATLANVDRLGELLAAWRADIDSEPLRPPPSVVDFAAAQQPVVYCLQQKPDDSGYVCSLRTGHDGDHQTYIGPVATWPAEVD